ncbi:glycosyltransferase [Nonomuraea sp. NPDC046570]|uniref:glycosyltransferase n=1 Tax=Nonomuraea sp. NPDC046570 TaxID=3155255 RepID=UPI00340A8787
MTGTPRIRRNDFGSLTPPELGRWEPSLTVTVVIPSLDCQDTLDLTLAALSAQSYPAHLLDVIVVDDGSRVPLRVPALAPARTRVLPSPEGGWGRAWAVQAGADAAGGDVVFVLDSDMVPHRRHVEAQMRWHHLAPYLVVLGWIDFTERGELPAPSEVREALEGGHEGKLFHLSAHRHEWAEKIIEQHDGLRAAPSALASRVHVGATVSYPAALLRAAGGLDTSLVLAEDTELGYRLTQRGAVFVPEPASRAWHVGLPTAMRSFAELKRYNDPFVADRVPYRRYLRLDAGRQWLVPYVDAVVDARGASYEDVRASVDGLLAATLPDVRVTVLGDWDALTGERRSPLGDPLLDLRLVHAQFEHDPRVRLTPGPGDAPFRLRLPPGWVPADDTLERLVTHLEEQDGGLLCVALEETREGVLTARLERTAAVARAELVGEPGDDLDDLIHELFGVEWVDGESWGFKPRPPVYPPRRRPVPESRRLALQHEKELARLRKRAAALQAEVTQLRREAGKGRRDAERWREKAERWRREAVRLGRERDRTILRRAVRKVRGLAFPDT